MPNDLARFDRIRTAAGLEMAPAGQPAHAALSASAEQAAAPGGIRPLFFNGDRQRLFGVFYEPFGERRTGSPILVCPPIGHEYVRSYKAIRKLCGRLSQSGFAVFKFDYAGLGDSYGDGSEADVAEWRNNIRTAAAELCRASGQSEITVVGLRFGAALAAGVRLEGSVVSSLVLWDPIVNGAGYLAELRQLHRVCLVDTLRYRTPQSGRTSDSEILGFRFPPRLQASMGQLSLLNKPFPYSNCFLVTSSQTPEYDELTQSLNRNTKGRFTHETVSEPAGWDDSRQVESALTANRAVAAINAKIAGGFV